MNGHVPISSLRLNTSWNSSVFIRNWSNSESSRLSFWLSISASVMCLHLSSGSNHGYLSSLVWTLVSSLIVSVHVDILGISDGSISLSHAIGWGLKVGGVTLSHRY